VNLHIGKLPPELAVGMVIIGRGRCQLTVQGGTDTLVVVSECIDVGSDLGPHRGQVTQQPSQPVLVLGKEHCKQESRDSIPRQAICTYIYLSMHPSIHLYMHHVASEQSMDLLSASDEANASSIRGNTRSRTWRQDMAFSVAPPRLSSMVRSWSSRLMIRFCSDVTAAPLQERQLA
jgi:hypothetical protein